MTVTSNKRNVAIGSGVVVLLLAALGYYFFARVNVGYSSDSISVTDKTVELPAGFEEKFQDVTSLLLVDKQGKVTAITSKGDKIDLCGLGSKNECEVNLTTDALMDALTGARKSGRCDVGGEFTACHKDTATYPFHKIKPGKPDDHHGCDCK